MTNAVHSIQFVSVCCDHKTNAESNVSKMLANMLANITSRGVSQRSDHQCRPGLRPPYLRSEVKVKLVA